MARLPDPCDRPWLTVAEVAEITGEGEKAIRAALDAGHLPLLRVGRYVRVPTQRLYDLLGMTSSRDGAGASLAPAATTAHQPGHRRSTDGNSHDKPQPLPTVNALS